MMFSCFACYILDINFNLDWELVSKNKECDNAGGSFTHSITSVSKCAQHCRNKATMFVYQDSNNNCACPDRANSDGTCKMRTASGRDLYRFSKFEILIYHFLYIFT